jgi:hypothetical protein
MATHLQDFQLPFVSAAAVAHTITNLQPRQVRQLDRICLAAPPFGELLAVQAGGVNLHLGAGFPLAFLDSIAQDDEDNQLGIIMGPSNPLELQISLQAAAILRGAIGLSPVDDVTKEAILDDLAEGELVGWQNYTWGLGFQSIAAGASFAYSVRIPRAATLRRFCVGTNVALAASDLVVTLFNVRGDPVMGRSANYDAIMANSAATDQDGLRMNLFVETNDLVEITFTNNSAGVIQVVPGFFID